MSASPRDSSRDRRSVPRAGPPAAPEVQPPVATAAQAGDLDYAYRKTRNATAWASNLDALATIACIYLALITIGFAAFRFLPQLQPAGASRQPDRAFFAAANTVSLTGFTQNTASAHQFPAAGQALIAGLAVASALLGMIGAGWFLRSILGLRGLSMLKIAAISAALVCWPLVFSFGLNWFDALSTGSGLGWATTPGVASAVPSGWRWLALAGSVPATLGPIPIACLLGIVRGRRVGEPRLASSILLATSLVYLVALLAFVACKTDWTIASFEALNTRSLGLAGNGIANLPPAMPWLMIVSMLIGAGPGSTAGGLSVLPLIILAAAVWRSRNGDRLTDRTTGVAIAWAGLFLVLLAALLVGFAATGQPMPGDRQLFLITSAFCNVGLSFDPLGVTGVGLVVICAAMLIGRLLPMLMLCWMAAVVGDASDEATSDEATKG